MIDVMPFLQLQNQIDMKNSQAMGLEGNNIPGIGVNQMDGFTKGNLGQLNSTNN